MTTIDISSNLLEDNNIISLEQYYYDIPVQQAISFLLGDSIEFNYNENENENWTKKKYSGSKILIIKTI